MVLQGSRRQVKQSLNLAQFIAGGPALVAAVNLKRSQKTPVARENVFGQEDSQAESFDALPDGADTALSLLRQRNERYHVAKPNVDRGAHFVQNGWQWRAHKNQFEYPPLLRREPVCIVASAAMRP